MSDRHPTKRLTSPSGETADIDVLLVPLIEALWAAGYDTIGCCQDLGESLAGHERKSAYWKGYVLLEMPLDDACDLLDEIKFRPQFEDKMHWAADGAWDVTMPVMPIGMSARGRAGLGAWVQVHFPADQLDDLVKVVTQL